jgi:hypothetical protein
MDIESLKIEIIEWICQLDDESILQELLEIKKNFEKTQSKNIE